MRLSLLLFGLYLLLWLSSKINRPFKKFILNNKVRLMIKTEDGRYARMFVFDKGKISSVSGPNHACDTAIVWKDPKTAFWTMLKKDKMEAFFYAAAEGKMKIKGMNVYALWFDQAMSHIM